MDPYKILELPRNFTLEQLRNNYKKIALQVHPDKSQLGSDYLFKMVTTAYKTLLKEYEKQQSDKPYNQLKNDSQSFIEQQQRGTPSVATEGFSVASGGGFNVDRFNQIFNQYKIEDTVDVGYGNWMSQSSSNRDDISITNNIGKFDLNRFNQTFETTPVQKQKKIIKYTEPEAVISNKRLGFAELGIAKIGDFSGDNLTNKRLNYTDYKVAHTTSRLVDNRAIKNRKEYNNVKELEADRVNISYQLSEKELQRLAKKKAQEEEMEKQRLANIEQLNRFLLGNR
jgi:curved DNA-binding protein CbpA